MQLDDALIQIAEIRQRMARSEVFRGYRAATVGMSGLLGVGAAMLQTRWVPAPDVDLGRYLVLWVGVAAISLMVAGGELTWRARIAGPGLARQLTVLAVEQFLPCVVVGAVLTACIYWCAPEVGWILPGLWACIFSLGIFASYRLLPRQVFWVGVFYLLCGVWCVLWGQGRNALSPWLMGVTFGGGQLISAMMLYWILERRNGTQTLD